MAPIEDLNGLLWCTFLTVLDRDFRRDLLIKKELSVDIYPVGCIENYFLKRGLLEKACEGANPPGTCGRGARGGRGGFHSYRSKFSDLVEIICKLHERLGRDAKNEKSKDWGEAGKMLDS